MKRLHATGFAFAFAKTATILPELLPSKFANNAIDGALMTAMTGVCDALDIVELNSCVPWSLETPRQIEEAWRVIFSIRRRLGKPDERQGITDEKQLLRMWRTWQWEWFAENLTEKQQKQKWNKKTSIFNAWCYRVLGGRSFIMAMWQIGITGAPTPEPLNSDVNGVLEHAARHFASWTRNLVRAVRHHKRTGPSKC